MNYIVYKIINKINEKIYIGCHNAKNIYDDYMGSGKHIKRAIEKYGLENFEKIILYNFDNKLDMLKKEAELVNREFIKRNDVYNIIEGGGFNTTGFARAFDENGKQFLISVDNPDYIAGKYTHSCVGTLVVKDKDNNMFRVSTKDARYLSGELISICKDQVPVKDIFGNTFGVNKNDPRYISGELKYILKGLVTVKDKDGNYFNVSVDDPRIKTGELVGKWKGNHHTDETKKRIGENSKIHQKGIGNSQYGKIWINNAILKQSKSVQKEEIDIWIENGWVKGRKMKFK
jgi:hypothetical protein